ncbi:hypothetical protein PHMEG_00025707, partial [Phytophthora megakarya]
MITRGTTTTPNSPSSRAEVAPPVGDSRVEDPVIVDVTEGGDSWASTAARRTSNPPPLRTSKRGSGLAITGAALAEARKGKKKLTKRGAPAAATEASRKKATDVDDHGSETDSVDKSALAPPKRAKKTPARAPAEETQPAPTSFPPQRPDRGFDLGAFMASFEPGASSLEKTPALVSSQPAVSPIVDPDADVRSELRFLKDEVLRLRGLLSQDASTPRGFPRTVVTAPNAKGELPPNEVCFLTSSSFPESAKKAKGDYNPPQAHLLAASRMF